MSPLTGLSSSKYLLTYLQYTSHQTGSYPSAAVAIPSPPPYRFAQYFPHTGRASAGVRPPVRYPRSHSNSQSHSQYHSPSYSTHYAHSRGHHHAQPTPVPVPVPVPVPSRHSSQLRSRRPSDGGPQVAEFHFNPALAYPSHSHSEPMYTHTKSIVRNKGGPPPALVVSHRICSPRGRERTHGVVLNPTLTQHAPPRDRRPSLFDGLTRRNPAPTKRIQFRPKASVRTF